MDASQGKNNLEPQSGQANSLGERLRAGSKQVQEMRVSFREYLLPIFDNPEDVRNILSVACGQGFEAGPLLEIFPNAHFLGIDIDQRIINQADEINRDLGKNVQFKTGNAEDSSSLEKQNFDLVIVRHPAVRISALYAPLNPSTDWATIFRNSSKVLRPGGVLAVYTYTDKEAWEVMNYLDWDKSLEVQEPIRDKHHTPRTALRDEHLILGRKL